MFETCFFKITFIRSCEVLTAKLIKQSIKKKVKLFNFAFSRPHIIIIVDKTEYKK